MTHAGQDDVTQISSGFVRISESTNEGHNPIVHHLSVFKTRARMLGDAQIERRAQELQAASSYADWNGLSDDDKELWRHMARLDLC